MVAEQQHSSGGVSEVPANVRRARDILCVFRARGGVAEWTIAAVLKTADPQGSVGSNPTPSAMKRPRAARPSPIGFELAPDTRRADCLGTGAPIAKAS
jgi:hypothetical protein